MRVCRYSRTFKINSRASLHISASNPKKVISLQWTIRAGLTAGNRIDSPICENSYDR